MPRRSQRAICIRFVHPRTRAAIREMIGEDEAPERSALTDAVALPA